MAFHPLVYFLTGNIYDPDKNRRTRAVQKHRQLETLIDIYLCGGLDRVDSYPLAPYLRALEAEQAILFWEAARGGFSIDQKDEVINAILSAYKTFALIQSICTHTISRRILASVDRLLPQRLKEMTVLLYSSHLARFPAQLERRFIYRHPFSGEQYEVTFPDLFNQAVENSINFCHLLEKIVSDTMKVEELPMGPSLELALPGVSATEMKYFASHDIFSMEHFS